MEAADRLRPHQLSVAPLPPLEFHGPPSSGRAVLALPGYGDTPEVVTRHLHLIDPTGTWTIAVAEPPAAGPHGPMWYLVDDDGPDAEGVAASVASVAAARDAVAAHAGTEAADVVLVGYSQGGATALATLLDPGAGPVPRAVASLAGYLPHRDEPHLDLARAAGVAVLVAHGRDDDMVEPLRGRSAGKVLTRAGADVTWAEVDGGHRLGPALVAPLARWLAGLAATRARSTPPA